MRTVWKYDLNKSVHTTLNLPMKSTVLRAELQGDWVCLWVLHEDSTAHRVPRKFEVVGTGHEVPDNIGYIGSVFPDPFVFHVFEVRP